MEEKAKKTVERASEVANFILEDRPYGSTNLMIAYLIGYIEGKGLNDDGNETEESR